MLKDDQILYSWLIFYFFFTNPQGFGNQSSPRFNPLTSYPPATPPTLPPRLRSTTPPVPSSLSIHINPFHFHASLFYIPPPRPPLRLCSDVIKVMFLVKQLINLFDCPHRKHGQERNHKFQILNQKKTSRNIKTFKKGSVW